GGGSVTGMGTAVASAGLAELTRAAGGGYHGPLPGCPRRGSRPGKGPGGKLTHASQAGSGRPRRHSLRPMYRAQPPWGSSRCPGGADGTAGWGGRLFVRGGVWGGRPPGAVLPHAVHHARPGPAYARRRAKMTQTRGVVAASRSARDTVCTTSCSRTEEGPRLD